MFPADVCEVERMRSAHQKEVQMAPFRLRGLVPVLVSSQIHLFIDDFDVPVSVQQARSFITEELLVTAFWDENPPRRRSVARRRAYGRAWDGAAWRDDRVLRRCP